MFFNIKPSDRAALVTPDGSCVTYAELADRASFFKEKCNARRLALCLCENSPASVIGYVGFLGNGTVPLLLDKKIDPALLSNLMDIYRPTYLYVPGDMADRFSSYTKTGEMMSYALLRTTEEEKILERDELALLLTTSGSTGSPKLVRQSYTNIQSNAEAIAEYLELTEDERPITTLPMNYTYGLSIINSHLLVGATILMTDYAMTMKPFWNFAKEQRATSFGGVPFTYEMLKKIKFFKMDLPDLRYMTQAGGKLSPELHREFAEWCEERGKKFIVMYGQTEATARMAYLPAERSLEKYGSMGFAIPGGKFILEGTDGREITEPDVVGELIYEGPNVTLGYAVCLEDLDKEDERHGRLATGDMAKRDADGFYYIVGRKKRFLKVFGNRVNLDEIDRLLKQKFDGVDFASAGTDDHVKTYMTDAGRTAEVRRWLSETTHLSESAFEVFYIDEIPKNEAGKVLYVKLPQ